MRRGHGLASQAPHHTPRLATVDEWLAQSDELPQNTLSPHHTCQIRPVQKTTLITSADVRTGVWRG